MSTSPRLFGPVLVSDRVRPDTRADAAGFPASATCRVAGTLRHMLWDCPRRAHARAAHSALIAGARRPHLCSPWLALSLAVWPRRSAQQFCGARVPPRRLSPPRRRALPESVADRAACTAAPPSASDRLAASCCVPPWCSMVLARAEHGAQPPTVNAKLGESDTT